MAVFEIEPSGIFNDSLMRNEPDLNIAQLKLHYKLPENGDDMSLTFPVQNNYLKFTETDSSLRFATAVTMFGGLLKQSELWNNYNWDDILKIARPAVNMNDYAQKEFLTLVEKAKIVYEPYNKKKKKKRSDDE